MNCYCHLKIEHDCPEMLASYEEQYKGNFPKLKFKRNKVRSGPRQKQFFEDICEVKKFAKEGGIYSIDGTDGAVLSLIKMNAVVSHFPKEFTKEEKLMVYTSVLSAIPNSKYFLMNGRITGLGVL